MAWVRRLPSGLWAATVRSPAGRITESFELKSAANDWGREQESQVRRGEWIDPRLAKTTVGEMWDRYADSRRLEKASRRRDESHWRCHVEPRWRRVPVGAVLKPDITGWVVQMERRGVGAATIQGSLGVLRGLLRLAVDAGLLRANPASEISAPRRAAHLDRVLVPHEDELLLASLDRQFPDRPDARLLVELMLYHGLRWEEAAAIDREHVNRRRRLIDVGPVVERDGTIRPYPKSPAGERSVPVDEQVWPRLLERLMAVPAGGLLITAARGGVLHYSSWHDRVWQRGLVEVVERGPRGKVLNTVSVLGDPRPTPHDLRHTYGTRLGEQGVPVHEIMALMGHEDLESAQRYLHAGEDRFDRAREATTRARRAVSHP